MKKNLIRVRTDQISGSSLENPSQIAKGLAAQSMNPVVIVLCCPS